MVSEIMGSSPRPTVTSIITSSQASYLTSLSLSFSVYNRGKSPYFLVLVREVNTIGHVKKSGTVPAKNRNSTGVDSFPRTNITVPRFSPFPKSPSPPPSPAQQIQPKEGTPSSQSLYRALGASLC